MAGFDHKPKYYDTKHAGATENYHPIYRHVKGPSHLLRILPTPSWPKQERTPRQESLPLQLSPLRRPQKNRFRYIPTLRTTAQGTSASNPIVIDEGEHRASMGTQDALQNNKNHPRQTIRAATTTHMAVPITTTATGHRPGPDSSTTRPAVYPARIAHAAGGLSTHTSSTTDNQTEQALLGHPSSRIVRHPLNDTSHSGRRAAVFSPRK